MLSQLRALGFVGPVRRQENVYSMRMFCMVSRVTIEFQRLPWRVIYLLHGEENIVGRVENELWRLQSCDVLRLTYRTRRNDSLYFPTSKLTEGRNALYYAACGLEVLQKQAYRYYVFGDAGLLPQPWPYLTYLILIPNP